MITRSGFRWWGKVQGVPSGERENWGFIAHTWEFKQGGRFLRSWQFVSVFRQALVA